MSATVRELRAWLSRYSEHAEVVVLGDGHLVVGFAAFGENPHPIFAPSGFDKVALLTTNAVRRG